MRFARRAVGKLSDKRLFRHILLLHSAFSGGSRIEVDEGACGAPVEVVYRLFVVAGLVLGLLRFYQDQYQDSFLYLGGLHGYNVSNWLVSQAGVPGVWLLLLVTAICFLIYLSARTIVWLRKLFSLSFLKRKEKAEKEKEPGETPEEFNTSGCQGRRKRRRWNLAPSSQEPESAPSLQEPVGEESGSSNEITLDLGNGGKE